MKIYLDDDSASQLLARLLRRGKHSVMTAADAGKGGEKDASHLMYAIRHGYVLLTQNHDDFELLHGLVRLVGGHHPGVLVVRKDNDTTRDMEPRHIVRAIRNLLAAGVPVADELNILNYWR